MIHSAREIPRTGKTDLMKLYTYTAVKRPSSHLICVTHVAPSNMSLWEKDGPEARATVTMNPA